MIYFSNSQLDLPHMTFIGRWTPFHKGHEAIIIKKTKEHPDLPVLIMIRNTPLDAFTPIHRAEIIKQWFIQNNLKGTIMIIPNIEGVYWGRGVGYNREYVDIDKNTQKISATEIRSLLKSQSADWRSKIALNQHPSLYTDRAAKIIERGLVIWLTGYPCSGKTTISNNLADKIKTTYPYLKIQILDGDLMRANPIGQKAGFTKQERAEHIVRMAHLAKMLADHGILVICAFVSPERNIRSKAKTIIDKSRFIEVYVNASKKTRLTRDIKGMYKKALRGELKNFTGVNAFYQIPQNPDITCNTNIETVDESTLKIYRHIFNA